MREIVYYSKETPLADAVCIYKDGVGKLWLENRNRGRTMVFEIEGELKNALIEMLIDDWKENHGKR